MPLSLPLRFGVRPVLCNHEEHNPGRSLAVGNNGCGEHGVVPFGGVLGSGLAALKKAVILQNPRHCVSNTPRRSGCKSTGGSKAMYAIRGEMSGATRSVESGRSTRFQPRGM